MTVRISKTDDTLRIDGRLDASNVEALHEVSEDLSVPVKLDLTNLLSADEQGMTVILDLLDAGAELSGANPYFKLLIDIKRDKRKSGQRSTKG